MLIFVEQVHAGTGGVKSNQFIGVAGAAIGDFLVRIVGTGAAIAGRARATRNLLRQD